MCLVSAPDPQPVKELVIPPPPPPPPPAAAQAATVGMEKPESQVANPKRRNPLRIDRDAPAPSGGLLSGLNIPV
jgi:hypothetical protein